VKEREATIRLLTFSSTRCRFLPLCLDLLLGTQNNADGYDHTVAKDQKERSKGDGAHPQSDVSDDDDHQAGEQNQIVGLGKGDAVCGCRRGLLLDVWKKGIDIVERIYNISKTFPKTEKYCLLQQMQKAAISIPSNIAEGYAR